MPLAIKLPAHPEAPAAPGPYPSALNVLSRKETAVQRQLRRAGLAGYEPLTQATLLALAQQAPAGSAFYDVGAHIGLYSALLSAVHGNRGLDVFAFEPTPATAAIGRTIRDVNGLGFELVEAAVSSAPGTAELFLSDKAESSNSLNPGHRRSSASVRVPVVTLDGFTAERGAAPHVIKVDVETYEADVLRGGLATIRRHRPWIVCELLPSSAPEALRDVLATLVSYGYGLHVIEPQLPWPGLDADTYRAHVGHHCRDWLLAPRPLSKEFHRLVRQWLIAILACDETTNLTVPGGTPFPDGWNAPHGTAGAVPSPGGSGGSGGARRRVASWLFGQREARPAARTDS
ncbi:FkbM family methyltransferase [Streptomyces sp. G45]|uniref:FkbM family methyltransferase n=1 Tax=Streptomyces sp. G45 TaxID=3406627 RepID=UPI003C1F276F